MTRFAPQGFVAAARGFSQTRRENPRVQFGQYQNQNDERDFDERRSTPATQSAIGQCREQEYEKVDARDF